MGLVLGERKFSLVADLTIFVHAGVSVWEVYKGSISIISMFLQLSLMTESLLLLRIII